MLFSVIAVSASCSVSDGVDRPLISTTTTIDPASTTEPQATTTSPTTTTTTTLPPERCPEPLLPESAEGAVPSTTRIGTDEPGTASVEISAATFRCSDVATVTEATDPDAVAAAAELAVSSGGPLLLGSPGGSAVVDRELRRLQPERVIRVGYGVRVELPGEASLETISPGTVTTDALAGLRAGPPAPEDPAPATPSTTTTTTATTTTATTDAGEPDQPEDGDPPDPEAERVMPARVGAAAGDGSRGTLWLAAHDDYAMAAAAAVAAIASGGRVVVVDAADLRSNREVVTAVRSSGQPPAAVFLVGDITEEADWQLPVLLGGHELPGGGLLLFPGRRMVAFYGSPLTPLLGVLGEQDPDATIDRLAAVAAPYGADGLDVLPAFELIATVADVRAGPDGNYSNELDPDLLRPWIEAAGEHGLYVLLDLQPGRTDFLTQAKRFEEFLRLPHVGLALDPEWRLGPDEVHLEQFGSVGADEVNAVAAWLADIVRSENLPQKMLLVHQFRLSMIPDRELIEKPAELAMVIQMDGQGPIESKYETWNAITAAAEGEGWWWGWKNFYDEDSPTPTPEQVLDLQPTAVYVSYQ